MECLSSTNTRNSTKTLWLHGVLYPVFLPREVSWLLARPSIATLHNQSGIIDYGNSVERQSRRYEYCLDMTRICKIRRNVALVLPAQLEGMVEDWIPSGSATVYDALVSQALAPRTFSDPAVDGSLASLLIEVPLVNVDARQAALGRNPHISGYVPSDAKGEVHCLA